MMKLISLTLILTSSVCVWGCKEYSPTICTDPNDPECTTSDGELTFELPAAWLRHPEESHKALYMGFPPSEVAMLTVKVAHRGGGGEESARAMAASVLAYYQELYAPQNPTLVEMEVSGTTVYCIVRDGIRGGPGSMVANAYFSKASHVFLALLLGEDWEPRRTTLETIVNTLNWED